MMKDVEILIVIVKVTVIKVRKIDFCAVIFDT